MWLWSLTECQALCAAQVSPSLRYSSSRTGRQAVELARDCRQSAYGAIDQRAAAGVVDFKAVRRLGMRSCATFVACQPAGLVVYHRPSGVELVGVERAHAFWE